MGQDKLHQIQHVGSHRQPIVDVEAVSSQSTVVRAGEARGHGTGPGWLRLNPWFAVHALIPV